MSIRMFYLRGTMSPASGRGLMPSHGTRLVQRAENRSRVDREEFDRVVKTSILETIRVVGDDYLDLFLALLQRKNGIGTIDSATLHDVEVSIDSLFARFAIAIKHVIMFRSCATLRLEPQKVLTNLEWTIQVLRSSCW